MRHTPTEKKNKNPLPRTSTSNDDDDDDDDDDDYYYYYVEWLVCASTLVSGYLSIFAVETTVHLEPRRET